MTILRVREGSWDGAGHLQCQGEKLEGGLEIYRIEGSVEVG